MLSWFGKVASSLETLVVKIDNRLCLLHPLLGQAAILAPKLRNLNIRGAVKREADGLALLSSLSVLPQLRSLSFASLMFPEDGNVVELLGLLQLRCLEVSRHANLLSKAEI